MNRRAWLLPALLALAPAAARALGPHEVILLVNRHSETSLEVANHYARLRRIPPVNILHLDVPEGALSEQAEISWDDFQRTIQEPVAAEVRKRGLADHALAWVYAPDFPVRITGLTPPLSLQGATFVKGVAPDPEVVKAGRFHAPLYAGPDRPQGPYAESHSLEFFAASLRDRMPTPSMLLGVAGARGLRAGQIVDHLKATRAADGTRPEAPLWWVTNGDVRVQARGWQFAAAAAELAELGRAVRLSDAPPADAGMLGGLMLGQREIDPARYGTLAPGAAADHLTSFAALFHVADQTKLTAWLAHGAAAAAGAVAEPYANWAKFPHARLFAHSARGCTWLEAYAQSVRCPLELLVVGDPLCAPFAQPSPVTLALLTEARDDVYSNRIEFAAAPLQAQAGAPTDLLYLIDGRTLAQAQGPRAELDTRLLPDGWHELRVVAYRNTTVRHQSFATRGFQVRNHGRSVTARVLGDPQAVDLDHPLRIEVTADGATLRELALVAQERVVARTTNPADRALLLHPRLLGAGPQQVQAVAVYDDRMAVRSAPLDLQVRRLNQAPSVERFTWAEGGAGGGRLGVQVKDAEGDVTLASWGEWLDGHAAGQARFQVAGADTEAAWSSEGIALRGGSGGLALCRVADLALTRAHRWSTRMRRPRLRAADDQAAGGLAFNIQNPRTFDGFGWFSQSSSWAFIRVVDGVLTRAVTRGAPEQPGAWTDLAVYRSPAGGLEAEVDGVPLCRWADATWSEGGAGLFFSAAESRFQHVAVYPPLRTDVGIATNGLQISTDTELGGLFLRVSDGRAARDVPAVRP